jgi:UDP-N-acetylglucosamine--dolichyl-phosphate N-acetylglucosaminephosphotransferase
MEPILILTIFISFLVTFLITPYWIKKAREYGMVSRDMHKIGKENVVGNGGIPVLFGLTIGILSYIALRTFYFKSDGETIFIFALLSAVLISAIVGLMDSLLGWKKGLSRKTRLIIIAFAAIPLMVVNAGESSMFLPIIGKINLGLFFPLVIIPFGIVGATTTFNFLAGYNGLESSQGAIILGALSIATYLTGNPWLSIICLCGAAALIAFYVFNKYPADIFPGDVLTYSIGTMIAAIAVIGNIEKIAIIFFMPYIIETILKLKGGLKKESFAKLNSDGSLDMPYDKVYGLEHLSVLILKKIKKNKKVYEKEVVYLINGFQIIVILIGFLAFF